MGQSRSSTGNQRQVVIHMSRGVFYGLIATVLGVATLVVVFFVGLRLGGNRAAGPTVAQPAYSAGQPYAAPPSQPQQVAPVQPQAGTSNQPAPRPSSPPAGSEVPIGDNPRLALPDLAKTNYVLEFGEVTLEQGQVTKEVLVRNTGVKDLVISDVQTTCNCTQAAVDKSTVPPAARRFCG